MGTSADSAQEKRSAVLGTIAMGLAPAVFAGAVPWRITRWRVRVPVPGGAPAQILGAALIGTGAAAVGSSFVRFAAEGVGTPAPIAPPKYLVVGGLYRYVRNPMYLALEAASFGPGLLLGQPSFSCTERLPPCRPRFLHIRKRRRRSAAAGRAATGGPWPAEQPCPENPEEPTQKVDEQWIQPK